MASKYSDSLDLDSILSDDETVETEKEEKSDEPEETWEQEGFDDFEAYQDYYVRFVDDLLDQSRKHWKPIKQRWMEADKRLELEQLSGLLADSRPTRTDLALTPAAVEKAIAATIDSLPRPTVGPKQVSDEDMSGGLNYFMGEVLDSNYFDLLMARVELDKKRFGIGSIKQSIDPNHTGPFGQPNKIVLTKTDPRYIWPDPLGKSWRWADLTFLIVAEPMDLAEIRTRYTDRGFLVQPESNYSRKNEGGDDAEGRAGKMEISSPNADNGYKLGERNRALVKELWLKDQSKKFVQDEDDDGNPQFDPDGEPLGKFVLRYPNGRLIITANKVVLFDAENPFRHGEPPYTFFENRLSSKLFTFGDVELLARLEDKINIIHKDMMKNARVNINSPYVVSNNAFDSPEKYKNITNEETLVIVKNQGAEVARLTPTEFPQFVFPLVSWLTDIFNDLSGVSSIMQGGIEKGAQLSADAIGNLQGSSAGGLKMKARLLEHGLTHLGFLLQWNVRQFYSSEKTITIQDPSNGKQVQVNWNPDADQPDYSVDIQVGSSLPGTKQGAQQLAMQLYGNDAIDRPALLDALQYPGRDQIVSRIDERVKKEAALAAAGVAVSLDGKSSTGPGRKKKTFKM